MPLASITEFGVSRAAYRDVLSDLHAHASRKEGRGFASHQLLVATLGSTDLVEILLFDHYLHWAQVGGSSAQAFRRSTGALIADITAGPSRYATFRPARALLEENEQLPLLAVSYLKFSPLVSLAIPHRKPSDDADPAAEASLAEQVVERIQAEAARFDAATREPAARDCLWSHFHAVLKAMGVEPEDSPAKLHLCPLLGMDSVELVLLQRAANLEQVAALAWALRHLRVGTVWNSGDHPEACENAGRLAFAAGEGPADLSAFWDDSPVFDGTTTILGTPLRREGDSWRPEYVEDTAFAGEAAFLCRSVFPAGEPMESRSVGNKLGLVRESAAQPTALPPGSGGDHAIMLFDRADHLHLPDNVSVELVGGFSWKEIRSHFERISGLDSAREAPTAQDVADSKEYQVYSSTEVGVRLRLTPVLEQARPSTALLNAFKHRLRKTREFHLSQRKDSEGWVRQFLDGAKKQGLIYPVVNATINLLSAVLNYLEDDLEEFVDLLPALRRLVERSMPRKQTAASHTDETSEDRVRDFERLFQRTEALAASRGRRDHPLRYPRGSISFEFHAGYRMPRDAFIAFVEAIDESLKIQPLDSIMLVLDSAYAAAEYEPAPAGVGAIRISPMILHNPVHWVFAHELAHSRFKTIRLKHLGPEVLKAQQGMGLAAWVENPRWPEQWTIQEILDGLTDLAKSGQAGPTPYDPSNAYLDLFCRNLGGLLTEVLADVIFFDSQTFQPDTPSERDRLFWFLHGPTLVFAFKHRFGNADVAMEGVAELILRIFFFDLLTRHDPSEIKLWPGKLAGCLGLLRRCEDRLDEQGWTLREGQAVDVSSAMGPPEVADANRTVVHRLLQLSFDMKLNRGHWKTALGLMSDALHDEEAYGISSSGPALGDLISDSLRLLAEIRRAFRPQQVLGRHHGQSRGNQAAAMYRHYLREMVSQLRSSGDHDQDWWQVVEGHEPPPWLSDDLCVTPRWRLLSTASERGA